MFIRFIFVLALLVFGANPLRAEDTYPLSIATVYSLIGKDYYINFNPDKTNLKYEDARYLDHLFQITDEAVRARYFMMNAYKIHGHQAHYKNKYVKTVEMLMAALSDLDAPSETLKEVETLVTEAILEQYQFFTDLKAKYKDQERVLDMNWESEFTDKNVQSSHKKLIKAYKILQSTYVTEQGNNRKAFYDHLCALDFI